MCVWNDFVWTSWFTQYSLNNGVRKSGDADYDFALSCVGDYAFNECSRVCECGVTMCVLHKKQNDASLSVVHAVQEKPYGCEADEPGDRGVVWVVRVHIRSAVDDDGSDHVESCFKFGTLDDSVKFGQAGHDDCEGKVDVGGLLSRTPFIVGVQTIGDPRDVAACDRCVQFVHIFFCWIGLDPDRSGSNRFVVIKVMKIKVGDGPTTPFFFPK